MPEPAPLSLSRIPLGWGTYDRPGTTDCGERRCPVLRANESNASSPDAANFAANITVAPSGAIYQLDASGTWAGDLPPEHKQFAYEHRLVELGNVTVEKPEWAAEYLEHNSS